jgi:hypothetical protein
MRKTTSFKPVVESLEDRMTPSTFNLVNRGTHTVYVSLFETTPANFFDPPQPVYLNKLPVSPGTVRAFDTGVAAFDVRLTDTKGGTISMNGLPQVKLGKSSYYQIPTDSGMYTYLLRGPNTVYGQLTLPFADEVGVEIQNYPILHLFHAPYGASIYRYDNSNITSARGDNINWSLDTTHSTLTESGTISGSGFTSYFSFGGSHGGSYDGTVTIYYAWPGEGTFTPPGYTGPGIFF